jgi:triosephosphate isomerase
MESRENGAYTGEISPLMLQDLAVKLVIIGHSERRQYYNETDITVNEKTKSALAHHLTPIICVGETLQQREAGDTDAVVCCQVEAAVREISPADYSKLVFAYEPVWAIGTGKTCDSAEANRVCALIRQTLSKQGNAEQTLILYGGSVKPNNTKELMSQSDIDGALVGGASLEADSFSEIIRQALATTAVSV